MSGSVIEEARNPRMDAPAGNIGHAGGGGALPNNSTRAPHPQSSAGYPGPYGAGIVVSPSLRPDQNGHTPEDVFRLSTAENSGEGMEQGAASSSAQRRRSQRQVPCEAK